ncbi:MAG: DUF4145 domain-containing protein [Chitinispirillaceae bacterium]|jgi:DNA-directed RNA polymerase subunit RPC12/RpoP
MRYTWNHLLELNSFQYVCGYCGNDIASNVGYYGKDDYENVIKIYICHRCEKPTFFDLQGYQFPGPVYGNTVDGITDKNVQNIYDEARKCFSANSFTASVLCCRKLLMNIAISKGAEKGLNFIDYVDFLSDKNFVPPDGKEWVDHIRKKGNEATHEIKIMTEEEAKELLSFSEMLLKFVFEFPSRIKNKEPKKK